MIDCPKCEGSGFRSVKSSTIYDDIEYIQPNINTSCIECKGNGIVSRIKAFHLNKKYK